MAGTQAELTVQELDSLGARFCELSLKERQRVLETPLLQSYDDRTMKVYVYITFMCNRDSKTNCTVPAMLVPRMLGNEEMTQEILVSIMKEHGTEGTDWKAFDKSTIFATPPNREKVEYPIPGSDGAKITLWANCDVETKFYFMKPSFARYLVVSSSTSVGRGMFGFYRATNEEIDKLQAAKEPRGQQQQGASVISTELLDSLGERFFALGESDQKKVLNAPTLASFPDQTKCVFTFLTEMCATEKTGCIVPAMLVPAMLGMKWGTKANRGNFINNFLKRQGQEGVDWKIFASGDLEFNGRDTIEFPVPGSSGGEVLTITKGLTRQTSSPFVTPPFARELVLRSTRPLGRHLTSLYFAVQSEMAQIERLAVQAEKPPAPEPSPNQEAPAPESSSCQDPSHQATHGEGFGLATGGVQPRSPELLPEMAQVEEVKGVSEEQLDVISSRFSGLKASEQQRIIGAPALAIYSAKTKAVYSYLTEMCDKGKNDFTVPAMLVPAMLGMEWTDAQHQWDFVRNFLKKQGQEGVDWMFCKKSDLTFNPGTSSSIDFPVPGGEGATLTFKANCGPATKFPYVTPHFARVLVLRSNTPVGRSMAEFYLAVHDEVLKFLRGEALGFDRAGVKAVERVDTLKRKREELEVTEARSQQFFSNISALQDTIGFFRDTFDLDGSDKAYYKELVKKVVFDPLMATSAQGNAPAEDARVANN
ncbi:unnamed protein product [Durusdinium trenchii]|uniref:Uncharacterized protein n=1 Tax=Durusdinium trenchii TaxID=1381693 RepID=A0ABP0LHV8_9DINO